MSVDLAGVWNDMNKCLTSMKNYTIKLFWSERFLLFYFAKALHLPSCILVKSH